MFVYRNKAQKRVFFTSLLSSESATKGGDSETLLFFFLLVIKFGITYRVKNREVATYCSVLAVCLACSELQAPLLPQQLFNEVLSELD